ncbi:MAG: hypothetical protein ACI8RD_004335 [Bacillariaceae sp.]|jgi:hypothetical protein
MKTLKDEGISQKKMWWHLYVALSNFSPFHFSPAEN